MDEEDLLMQLMGAHEQTGEPPAQTSFEDTEAVDWDWLKTTFGLSDEEMVQLQMQPFDEGPSLEDRLEQLRPNMNLGPFELSLDGSIKEPRIEGRMRF